MSIQVDVHLRRGAFALDAAFAAGPGLTALFGRSGSGKTTLIDLIAGLARPDHGRIVTDGATLVDSAAGIFLPPHRRRVGVVFQDARLFPHLSVRTNLGYGRVFGRQQADPAGFSAVTEMPGSATSSTGGPRASPAASASGWRSGGRCSPSRACC